MPVHLAQTPASKVTGGEGPWGDGMGADAQGQPLPDHPLVAAQGGQSGLVLPSLVPGLCSQEEGERNRWEIEGEKEGGRPRGSQRLLSSYCVTPHMLSLPRGPRHVREHLVGLEETPNFTLHRYSFCL